MIKVYIVEVIPFHDFSWIDSVWDDISDAWDRITELPPVEGTSYDIAEWEVSSSAPPFPNGNDYILAECARPKGVF